MLSGVDYCNNSGRDQLNKETANHMSIHFHLYFLGHVARCLQPICCQQHHFEDVSLGGSGHPPLFLGDLEESSFMR